MKIAVVSRGARSGFGWRLRATDVCMGFYLLLFSHYGLSIGMCICIFTWANSTGASGENEFQTQLSTFQIDWEETTRQTTHTFSMNLRNRWHGTITFAESLSLMTSSTNPQIMWFHGLWEEKMFSPLLHKRNSYKNTCSPILSPLCSPVSRKLPLTIHWRNRDLFYSGFNANMWFVYLCDIMTQLCN